MAAGSQVENMAKTLAVFLLLAATAQAQIVLEQDLTSFSLSYRGRTLVRHSE